MVNFAQIRFAFDVLYVNYMRLRLSLVIYGEYQNASCWSFPFSNSYDAQ